MKDELSCLGRVFQEVQDQDKNENDVILVGDFNASPAKMRRYMGALADSLFFVIEAEPTNVLHDSIYDNILFDPVQTKEFIPGSQQVVRIDEMLGEYEDPIPDAKPVNWFARNVMDHCPVYAEFRADMDTD
ncbi:MAG: hypothetical protein NTW86_01315 [Candidatus Sumerlaeota bacterium]|nr:hypothetical protein [Candidatus Sumerlaeota bacterium]